MTQKETRELERIANNEQDMINKILKLANEKHKDEEEYRNLTFKIGFLYSVGRLSRIQVMYMLTQALNGVYKTINEYDKDLGIEEEQ